MSEVEQTNAEQAKKMPVNLLVLGVGVALLLGLLGLGVSTVYGVYQVSENPVVVSLARAFKIRVAEVNDTPILYSEYIRDTNSLRLFYAKKSTEVPYDKNQQSDQVLSRLIANILIQQTAPDLNDNLGVTLPEFFDRILEPTILEKKVAEQFATSTDPQNSGFAEEQVRARHILFTVNAPADDAKAKADATRVLKELQKGADFAELAKKYGTDGTKDQGGDLGWFGRGDMVKEFEDAAYALNKGELVKAPVKTQFGYHLIKTEDKRSTKNFSAYMNEKLKTAKIKVFGKIHNPFANLQGGATVTAQ